MTGFSVSTPMSQALRIVFQGHMALGHDERYQANHQENLLRMIEKRVQYNDMVYMGVCGGACCAGEYYWRQAASGGFSPSTGLRLFDFFSGRVYPL